MEKISVNYLSKMGLRQDNIKRLRSVLDGEHNEFDEDSISFKRGTETFVWGDLISENYEGRFMQTPIGFFIKLKNASTKIQYFISNENVESIRLNTLIESTWTTSLVQKRKNGKFEMKTIVVDPETFHMITDRREKVLNMDMDLYDETIVHATNDLPQDVIENTIDADNILEIFNQFIGNPYQILMDTPKM